MISSCWAFYVAIVLFNARSEEWIAIANILTIKLYCLYRQTALNRECFVHNRGTQFYLSMQLWNNIR